MNKEEIIKEFEERFGEGKPLRFEYGVSGTSEVRVLDDTNYSEIKQFILDALSQQKKEIREIIYEIKYRNHNPNQDCDCETCRITNDILKQLK